MPKATSPTTIMQKFVHYHPMDASGNPGLSLYEIARKSGERLNKDTVDTYFKEFYQQYGQPVLVIQDPLSYEVNQVDEKIWLAAVNAACEKNKVRRNPKTAVGVGVGLATGVFAVTVLACMVAYSFAGITFATIISGVTTALPFLAFLAVLNPIFAVLAGAAILAAAVVVAYLVVTAGLAFLTGKTLKDPAMQELSQRLVAEPSEEMQGVETESLTVQDTGRLNPEELEISRRLQKTYRVSGATDLSTAICDRFQAAPSIEIVCDMEEFNEIYEPSINIRDMVTQLEDALLDKYRQNSPNDLKIAIITKFKTPISSQTVKTMYDADSYNVTVEFDKLNIDAMKQQAIRLIQQNKGSLNKEQTSILLSKDCERELAETMRDNSSSGKISSDKMAHILLSEYGKCHIVDVKEAIIDKFQEAISTGSVQIIHDAILYNALLEEFKLDISHMKDEVMNALIEKYSMADARGVYDAITEKFAGTPSEPTIIDDAILFNTVRLPDMPVFDIVQMTEKMREARKETYASRAPLNPSSTSFDSTLPDNQSGISELMERYQVVCTDPELAIIELRKAINDKFITTLISSETLGIIRDARVYNFINPCEDNDLDIQKMKKEVMSLLMQQYKVDTLQSLSQAIRKEFEKNPCELKITWELSLFNEICDTHLEVLFQPSEMQEMPKKQQEVPQEPVIHGSPLGGVLNVSPSSVLTPIPTN